jgi:hypothetical protein
MRRGDSGHRGGLESQEHYKEKSLHHGEKLLLLNLKSLYVA